MGRFKEENGITRLQALINKAKEAGEKLPQELVDLASVVSPRLGSLLKAFTSLSEDKEASPLLREELLAALSVCIEEQKELSDRHKIDASGDNKAAKIIRPYSLAFSLVMTAYLTISKQWKFGEIDELYFDYWSQAGLLVLGFYFGSRGIEKLVDKWNNPKNS
ncbi:MAG: hypothetical protein MK172_08735 [Verrucomicrobiales bacterium]|nr:hypothetical protein [Verrucomicrobiales bacterium]